MQTVGTVCQVTGVESAHGLSHGPYCGPLRLLLEVGLLQAQAGGLQSPLWTTALHRLESEGSRRGGESVGPAAPSSMNAA